MHEDKMFNAEGSSSCCHEDTHSITNSASETNFQVIWRQMPMHGRMSGNVVSERRTIDPPPILELLKIEGNEAVPITEGCTFFYMSASLYDERGIECLDYAQTHISKDFPNLLGQRIESPLTLRDDRGSWGTYFVFKDLSVRSPGNYTLKFRLYDLESKNFPNTLAVKTPIRIQLSTSVFSIFKPKDFTGMAVSTELTKTFRNQGVKLSIRNKALHQT